MIVPTAFIAEYGMKVLYWYFREFDALTNETILIELQIIIQVLVHVAIIIWSSIHGLL